MNKEHKTILYLVVPCYNEEEVLPMTVRVLKDKMERLVKGEKISSQSRVMFVNDGSKDKTWSIIEGLCRQDKVFSGVNFSRNFGHQSAILAGMMTAKERADAVVTIDADLQQDIEALDEFLEKYESGCDIVYGVRNDRNSDGFFKKKTALAYYKLLHILGCKIITNHADYRLMSKKALNTLAEYKEVNLFLRGLIPQMGYKSDVVYFDVKEREAGQSKYTLKKMMTLAVDGITSLSVQPIHFITIMGFLVSFFSFLMIIWCIVDYFSGHTVPGYATTLVVSLFMGGLTILSLGIVGEYIGKIYMETKERPRYIIDSIVWDPEEEEEKKEDGKN